jgi:predicted nuclease with TOPRIM domain
LQIGKASSPTIGHIASLSTSGIDEKIKKLKVEKEKIKKELQKSNGNLQTGQDKKSNNEKKLQKLEAEIQTLEQQKNQIETKNKSADSSNKLASNKSTNSSNQINATTASQNEQMSPKDVSEIGTQSSQAAEYVGETEDPSLDNTYKIVRDENGKNKVQFNQSAEEKRKNKILES